jgi:RNA polymerase sigma-70 factor (ECF subfamily)
LRRKDAVKIKYIQNFREYSNSDCPEFTYRTKEFSNHIQNQLNSLPQKSKDVLIMNKVEKLTYKEISDKIGLSVKSVEKRMSIALKAYRELRNF